MQHGPIVVGVDASPAALNAAVVAERIAAISGTSCSLAHAVRDEWALLTGLGGARLLQLEEMQKSQLAHARQLMIDGLCCGVGGGLLETLTLRFGPPAAVLKDVARERHAGLLVLGGKHHTSLERWFGGSTCLDVARTAEVPLLITAGPRVKMKRVLVAVDLSAAAGPTLGLAERFAESIGAELRVLTVFEPLPAFPGAPPFDAAPFLALSQETLERDVWTQVRASGVQKFVRHGPVVDTLLHEADAWHADVVVVGSHGKNWAQRMLLGSVTERLINHLPASLLIAPVGTAAAALRRRRREPAAVAI